MRVRAHRRWPALLVCLAFLTSAAEAGDRAPFREYVVKAAFLYNFSKFVDWPPTAFDRDDSPFVIAVLGDDPFGAALESLQTRTVKGHPVVVRRMRRLPEGDVIHTLFISDSETDRLPQTLSSLADRPILTVSEADRFVEGGGMIRMHASEGRIRFEINRGAARNAGLQIRSDLLKLAARVVDSGMEEAQ